MEIRNAMRCSPWPSGGVAQPTSAWPRNCWARWCSSLSDWGWHSFSPRAVRVRNPDDPPQPTGVGRDRPGPGRHWCPLGNRGVPTIPSTGVPYHDEGIVSKAGTHLSVGDEPPTRTGPGQRVHVEGLPATLRLRSRPLFHGRRWRRRTSVRERYRPVGGEWCYHRTTQKSPVRLTRTGFQTLRFSPARASSLFWSLQMRPSSDDQVGS
jgi:hypothetical protein